MEYVNDVASRKKVTTQPQVAYASRLVVVAAGAFGSPSILERWVRHSDNRLMFLTWSVPSSGIGSADVLRKHGVPVVSDLPGVGENYLGKYGGILYSMLLIQ